LCVALHSPAFKASVTDLLDEKAYSKASGLPACSTFSSEQA